jgi:folate-binding protein YgfZ
MAPSKSSTLADYTAALSGAAFFPQVSAGYLVIGGLDRSAFLQRQTTNDVRLLSPERALVTALTSPTARILDVLTLLAESDAIVALTLPDRGAETARFLRSRIFFIDKVSVDDASAAYTQIDLLGPQAGEGLVRLGLNRPPQVGEVLSSEVAGDPIRVLGQRGFGYRLLAPADSAQAVVARLSEAGAIALTPQSFDLLRVEAGSPAAGHELVAEYTPLEAGLEWAISDAKGCYTGQEVIARQISYDKVTRHLVGLQAEAEVSVGEPLRSPQDERPAGSVTSAAISPRFGPIALGIIRRPFAEPGTWLAVGEPPGDRFATVTALPFQ